MPALYLIEAHMTNGKILIQLKDKIDDALESKKLRKETRLVLEVQQLFLIYLMEDHPRVSTMWSVFRPMVWAAIVFMTAIIGLLASGKMLITVK